MPIKVQPPDSQIPIAPLSASAFEQFGTVIQNPATHPSTAPSNLRTIAANQGSATKHLDVTHLTNFYGLAPSRKPAKAVMNMFVCAPRKLRSAAASSSSSPSSPAAQLFDVKILERHPFTSQTFIPVGLAESDPTTKYLVIVAPTLPPSPSSPRREPPYPVPTPPRRKRSLRDLLTLHRPSPYDNSVDLPDSNTSRGVAKPSLRPKGPGLPDLSNVKAFIADGSQAVTYSAGTWHAPMVVIGQRAVDFVVVQFANDVGLEDCQEVLLDAAPEQQGIVVEVDASHAVEEAAVVRAKL